MPVLNQDQIDALLQIAKDQERKPRGTKTSTPVAPRNPFVATHKPNCDSGPLRYYDQELRCASRGCSSPTHFKVSGIPLCSAHALIRLNDMIVEAIPND